MPFPTPNGPTINDLQYQSFGIQAAFNFNPNVFERLVANERVVLNLVGYSGTINTSEFLDTDENVQVVLDSFGPNLFSISVSESATLTENTAETRI